MYVYYVYIYMWFFRFLVLSDSNISSYSAGGSVSAGHLTDHCAIHRRDAWEQAFPESFLRAPAFLRFLQLSCGLSLFTHFYYRAPVKIYIYFSIPPRAMAKDPEVFMKLLGRRRPVARCQRCGCWRRRLPWPRSWPRQRHDRARL